MNRKQRMQNRDNARKLEPPAICPNCGKPGQHYMVDPVPSFGRNMSGWICQKPSLDREQK
jgi:hypothetical protein